MGVGWGVGKGGGRGVGGEKGWGRMGGGGVELGRTVMLPRFKHDNLPNILCTRTPGSTGY